MYGVGLAYNHDEQTLTSKRTNEPRNRNATTKRQHSNINHARSLSSNLISEFDRSTDPGPSNTPTHINTAGTPLASSTPVRTPIKVKRKSNIAVPKPSKSKKIKIGTNKILKDSAGVPIFPQYYRVDDKGRIAPDTDLDATNDITVINRQDNAQDQSRLNDPTRDDSGLWKDPLKTTQTPQKTYNRWITQQKKATPY